MPEHNPGQMGGTMRLGKRRTLFKSPSSILRKETDPERGRRGAAAMSHPRLCFPGKLYGDAEYVEERHRHRFEVRTALWLAPAAVASAGGNLASLRSGEP